MIKLDLATIGTLPYRNKKAKDYSEKCKAKGTEKLFLFIFIAFCLAVLLLPMENKYVYATKDGYVTEVKTKITSVDVDTNKVYVTYKGKEYSYFAEGKIATQGKITVKFDSQMRIIDAY